MKVYNIMPQKMTTGCIKQAKKFGIPLLITGMSLLAVGSNIDKCEKQEDKLGILAKTTLAMSMGWRGCGNGRDNLRGDRTGVCIDVAGRDDTLEEDNKNRRSGRSWGSLSKV